MHPFGCFFERRIDHRPILRKMAKPRPLEQGTDVREKQFADDGLRAMIRKYRREKAYLAF